MKAIHNRMAKTKKCLQLCSIRQIYKMKAIHNAKIAQLMNAITVFNTSNIQNESNSQLK